MDDFSSWKSESIVINIYLGKCGPNAGLFNEETGYHNPECTQEREEDVNGREREACRFGTGMEDWGLPNGFSTP